MTDNKVRLILGAIIVMIVVLVLAFPELTVQRTCRDVWTMIEGKQYLVRICD